LRAPHWLMCCADRESASTYPSATYLAPSELRLVMARTVSYSRCGPQTRARLVTASGVDDSLTRSPGGFPGRKTTRRGRRAYARADENRPRLGQGRGRYRARPSVGARRRATRRASADRPVGSARTVCDRVSARVASRVAVARERASRPRESAGSAIGQVLLIVAVTCVPDARASG
jgi:hypothetical protein